MKDPTASRGGTELNFPELKLRFKPAVVGWAMTILFARPTFSFESQTTKQKLTHTMSSNPTAPTSQSPSATYLKPPSASSTPHSRQQPQRVVSSSTTAAAAAAPPPPRAPVSVHATTTVSETASFHGTHPITIGSGTVIHPRARIYSFDGPVQIADGCVIGEKSTIGDNNSLSTSSSTHDGEQPTPIPTTRLSSSVIVGPHAVIRSGASVRSAAVIDALAVVHRDATVGSHSKVSSRCEVPEKAVVEDWTVVWAAGGGGIGQRKRRRLVGPAAAEAADGRLRPDAIRVEDARLIVLHKEREGLAKMIALSATGQKRR